ncbi:MAG: NUDIX domain-containing protein [Candidatus Marsarchaeota archaeon]|jgi:8-oxo-dGTP diphosphatase|nr:NUDIX domain-containing protein [Candidatus Marsarchaeota archaeon]MCL5111602.1 NUDIX domain-containing protein [Candidatus Marsarchaeota archaeon]
MKIIHKVAAVVIQNNAFLMVRKVGKDIWTSLGGKVEQGETEEEALTREIKEELDCGSVILEKMGDFESGAIFDDATVRLSTYLVELKGNPKLSDPEYEEFRFIKENYKGEGIKLPDIIEEKVIPLCISRKLLSWNV